MGITIESRNKICDLGYMGFNRFRQEVAKIASKEFGEHYETITDSMTLFDEDRISFFEVYNKKTSMLIKQSLVPIEIVLFCHMPDCEGEICQSQARVIYETIKNHEDEKIYGYSGREDCAKFEDLKAIFKDCAENGDTIEWS